jgi:long-subunit acyl-CoA synthetase (AMP-forming)
MAKNCIEWVTLDLAVLRLGGVVAGFEVGRFEAGAICRLYGLRLLFVDDSSENGSDRIALASITDWGLQETRGCAAPFYGRYKPNDICAVKFTSGSTGIPKGLEATVGSVNDSITSVEALFGHGGRDNILVFLRLALLQQRYWIYSALAFGHDVTVTDMDRVLDVAQAVRPTVIMGVPGFFDGVKSKIENSVGYDPSDTRTRGATIQERLGSRNAICGLDPRRPAVRCSISTTAATSHYSRDMASTRLASSRRTTPAPSASEASESFFLTKKWSSTPTVL